MAALHERLFESQPNELTLSPTLVSGEVPAELRGTLLRNGPGLFESGTDPLNFLDAHGMVAGVSFERGQATVFRNRHVRTSTFRLEQARGRQVRRRLFTNLPSRWSNVFDIELGNNAGHDVYAWGGKLCAAQDPGHCALDPKTLETIGDERWGVVPAKSTMSPMPRVDSKLDRLVGYMIHPGGLKPDRIEFVELDRSYALVHRSPVHSLSASPTIVHDCGFSRSWYVVTEAGPKLSAPRALFGARTIFESFDWDGKKSASLFCASRNGPRAFRVPLPGARPLAFHVANAYDEEDTLVVDLVAYGGLVGFLSAAPEPLRKRQPDPYPVSPKPVLLRILIDTVKETIVDARQLSELSLEVPETNPRVAGERHRYVYAGTRGEDAPDPDPENVIYFHGIAKLDTETGETSSTTFGHACFCSQPAFAPRASGAEDDGWLLVWLCDAENRRTDVVILDARTMGDPVARVRIPVQLPPPTHAFFADDLLLEG
jgi:all-trans-8'-apo-beta-carotenal 15,15'-oxygenase